MSARILIVGGGATAAATARQLRDELASRCQISVWDKARGAGGRMSTSRGPPGCGTADLGAQYVTITPESRKRNGRVYDELESAGVLSKLTAHMEGMRPPPLGTTHMVIPHGGGSLVKHFLNKSEVTPQFHRQVAEIGTEDGSECVITTTSGLREVFDVVVLTMPVPQILALGGSLRKSIESQPLLLSDLQAVEYSSRYGLALFYDKPDAVKVSWSACYISDHPVIRYVALDAAKRGQITEPTSVVVHTNVRFGTENVERTVDEVQPILRRHVSELFPDWPEPVSVKCQKWRYSQVSRQFADSPGHVVLCQQPLVVAAGDAFTHPNIDGCLTSANSVAECVKLYLASRPQSQL